VKGSGVVAYHERETISHDRGTIRDEWRLKRLHMERPEAEQRAIVAYCHEHKIDLSTAIMIEHRQVRFGGGPDFDREGGWTLLEVCRDEDHAIQSVDSYGGYSFTEDTIEWKATAVDPRLVAQRQREVETYIAKGIAAAEDRAAREQEEREAAERRQANQASEDAFVRLRDGSEAGRELTGRWNALATRLNENSALRDRLARDEALVALATEAMAAVTVPAKRKAIRAALARVEKIAPGIAGTKQKEKAA
jgi:hypothetical protein